MRKTQTAMEEELARLRVAIGRARSALEEAGHPRLLEAAAYEMKYLEARRAYLLEQARDGAKL